MSCSEWPFLSDVSPGWNQVLSTVALNITNDDQVELIDFNLPQSQQLITIPFTISKVSANYLPFGTVIYNKVDSSVFAGLTFTPINFATSSLTGLLSATVNTSSYYLKCIIAVVGT